MKSINTYLYPVLTALLLAAYSLHISSCANTKAPPSGGPKDTLAPIVVATLPDSNAVLVPRTKTEIILTFNEYIQLKDPGKNILLSPPQKKQPKHKLKGKSLVITFPEPLDSSRTYALNFGSALADNNEGNILENYVFSFSTGRSVDSLLLSGTVLNFRTLLPEKGIKVALYAEPEDSSLYRRLPDAVALTDEWGYFCLRNLSPKAYALYAFGDENNNHLYDPGSESVAFFDSLVLPQTVMRRGMPQLASYSMKDTAACLARPSELILYLFKETPDKQFILDYARTGERSAYIKFNAPGVQIDSFAISGIRQDRIIKQFNRTEDSLAFWIDDPGKIADTLLLGIKYYRTDTLGNLTPAVENLKLVVPRQKTNKENEKESQESARERDKNGRDENTRTLKQRKDLMKFKLIAPPEKVEQDGYVFEFSEPLVWGNFDTILFTQSTPKRIVTKVPFTVSLDSADIRRYILRPDEPLLIGNDYEMIVPQAAFRDINGFTNDSTYHKLSLPTNDRLSSITLDMVNVDARYIVELVNEKRDNVYRSYIITRDTKLLFPYLGPGDYSVRITEDRNNNGMLDPGSVLQKKQPEKVRLYTSGNGKTILKLPERTDLEQTIDVREVFRN